MTFAITIYVKDRVRTELPFSVIRENADEPWIGPKKGEFINLSEFKTENGDHLPLSPNDQFILLSIVSTRCRMVKNARELVSDARAYAADKKIKSFILSIDGRYEYSTLYDLFQVKEVYTWQSEKEVLAPTLKQMVVPSHILIDGNGKVLVTFPGGSAEQGMRIAMSRQMREEIDAVLSE